LSKGQCMWDLANAGEANRCDPQELTIHNGIDPLGQSIGTRPPGGGRRAT